MNTKTKIALRTFSLLFYFVGICFLVVLSWNYFNNVGRPAVQIASQSVDWTPTWTDWLFKGLVLTFLGFFCRFLDDLPDMLNRR